MASILLIFVVYIQNPKGGGLSSDFGSPGQLGGVKKTGDFLDKSTWFLATLLIALILLSNITIDGASGVSDSKALDADDTTTQQPITPPATTDGEQ